MHTKRTESRNFDFKIDIFLLLALLKNLVRHAKINCPCDVNNYYVS